MFSKFGAMFCRFFDQEWTQIFAILTAAMAALNTSLLFSWPSPSIPILISQEFPGNITMEQASYTAVIPSVASAISSPLYPWLMNRIGRKTTLLTVAIPQFLAWFLIARTSDINIIYVSRFLSGFVHSCMYATLPVYIGEITTPEVRGLWGNAMSCSVYFGLCLMNVVGGNLSLQLTAYIFAALPIIFFIIFIFMPESPYYYIIKGELEKGKASLKKLRKNPDIDKEFEEICLGIQRQLTEPGSIWDLFRVRKNFKALMVAMTVRCAQQFAGISAFAVHAQYLFQGVGGDISAVTSATIYSAALTIACFTGSIFLDKLGRRLSMVISCSGSAVILISVSLYFYFASDLLNTYQIDLPYVPIVGMLLYVMLYSLGLGIVPNLLLGELFATNVKAKALCILSIAFALFAALSTKVFQLLSSFHGMYAPFMLFGTCCVASTVFSFFCIPETSGKTLLEIQENLKEEEPSKDIVTVTRC